MPTMKEIMERDKKETLDYHNFEEWHKAGYRGKGINYLEIESPDDEHGQAVVENFKMNDYEGNAYLGNMRQRTSGEEVLRCDIKYYDSYIPIEQFIKELDIHIIGASLGFRPESSADGFPKPLVRYLKTLPVIWVGSAGNEGGSGVTGIFEYLGIMSAAIYLDNGEIKRELYSGVEDTVDFATLHNWREGTSFSQPVLSRMIADIMTKYGVLTQDKIYEVLKSISIDAGEEGKDTNFGWGVPILPEDCKIDILEEVDPPIEEPPVEEPSIPPQYPGRPEKPADKWSFRMLHQSTNFDWKIGDIIKKGDKICRMWNSGTKYIHAHIDGVKGIIKQWDLMDIEIGLYMSIEAKLRLLIVYDLFKYKPIITGKFLMENYMSDNNVDYNHWGMDVVPENRHETDKNYDMFYPLDTPGVVLNVGTYNDGTNFIIIGVDESMVYKDLHWAEEYYQKLLDAGIVIHEKRYDDKITRGEIFALLSRVLDKITK